MTKSIPLIIDYSKTQCYKMGYLKTLKIPSSTQNIKVSDVCIYKPGDPNKIGKEGKTSWDSFSYAIQMGPNVWSP